ncbi:hypothetical protein L218DRAFT_216684 [Marasmius fiardii PR-910]|nr:hypothetical protein L218DRAFT_216684 [Marasmius fiardii PR-910]
MHFRNLGADVLNWNSPKLEGDFAKQQWEEQFENHPRDNCKASGLTCEMDSDTTRAVPSCQSCRHLKKTCSNRLIAGLRKMFYFSKGEGTCLTEDEVLWLASAFNLLRLKNDEYQIVITRGVSKETWQGDHLPQANYLEFIACGMRPWSELLSTRPVERNSTAPVIRSHTRTVFVGVVISSRPQVPFIPEPPDSDPLVQKLRGCQGKQQEVGSSSEVILAPTRNLQSRDREARTAIRLIHKRNQNG